MSKSRLAWLALILLGWVFFPLQSVVAGHTDSPLPQYAADDVIAGVNSLRASYGLALFQVNDILNTLCQNQVDYMASIGGVSDYDAFGRHAGQRALELGYPLAGDLSLGGLISQNVFWGNDATAEDAIGFWMGDSIHQIALLDKGFTETGAAVKQVGSAYFYCQIAAQTTGGTAIPYTPPSSTSGTAAQPAVRIIVSTPNPDGSIIHNIRAGDTLFAISLKYGIPITTIEQLNGITSGTVIYPGNQLIIQLAFTPTPEMVISASTPVATIQFVTVQPTETMATETMARSALTPAPGISSKKAGITVAGIVAIALLFAGAIIALGSRNH
jgi:uncharacterized protein YkwD